MRCVDIMPGYRTDHSMIFLNIQFGKFKKGNSYWKFNNSLLKDTQYVEKIKSLISNVKLQYASDRQDIEAPLESISNEFLKFDIDDKLFFETLLLEIRGETISYSSFKKKQEDKRQEKLLIEINNLEKETDINYPILEAKKEELLQLRNKKMQGVFIRSRAKWTSEGEKPSKYFCALESRNFISKIIPRLELDNGELIYEQSQILTETSKFYEKLYKNNLGNSYVDLHKELPYDDIPKLSKDEAESLEGEITLNEASRILHNMKSNKSPGSNGFSSEFLKVFWKYIGTFVVRSINHGYRNNMLSITQRHGVNITLLPKGDKPKQYLKNWRPITLLNTVYKIASGCIAARFKRYLDKIINPDQTGFLPNRYIGENTRLIYDIMHYTEEEDIPGLLLLIDFEKAFDTVSWNFIEKTLNFFNFGPSIRKWVNLFNTNISSTVNQGGDLSKTFDIQRGCRQGDPLAPYIFLICSEILAIQIRKNRKN